MNKLPLFLKAIRKTEVRAETESFTLQRDSKLVL